MVIDPTTVTIAINAPDGTVEVPSTSVGIAYVAVGVFQYTWKIPANALQGNHSITWTATSPVATVGWVVNVLAASMNTWCTVDDVTNATGAVVSQSLVMQAGMTIDVACGRSFVVDGSRVGSRDLYFLRLATAYQAAWLVEQPDTYSRIDALDVSQGRSHTQLRDSALVIAPHARRALKRVSWLKTRSLHLRTPFTDGLSGGFGLDPLSSAADAYGPWTPIE